MLFDSNEKDKLSASFKSFFRDCLKKLMIATDQLTTGKKNERDLFYVIVLMDEKADILFLDIFLSE